MNNIDLIIPIGVGCALFRLRTNEIVFVCPECKNNVRFNVYSERSKDCWNVRVACDCGFDPVTKLFGGYQVERYGEWERIGVDNVHVALEIWNGVVAEIYAEYKRKLTKNIIINIRGENE